MHLNMSYTEVRNLPTKYRSWFLDRLVRYFKQKNEASQPPSKKEKTFMTHNRVTEEAKKTSEDIVEKTKKFYKRF